MLAKFVISAVIIVILAALLLNWVKQSHHSYSWRQAFLKNIILLFALPLFLIHIQGKPFWPKKFLPAKSGIVAFLPILLIGILAQTAYFQTYPVYQLIDETQTSG
jgi:hypothetical protein